MSGDFQLIGIEELNPQKVYVPDRLRAVSQDHVNALAESMAGGQLTPIDVLQRRGRALPRLIAGAHRLEACRIAGITVRACLIKYTGPKDSLEESLRLREIDENLIRHELSALDRAVFLAERQEAYEALHPETRRGHKGADARHGRANEMFTFAQDTADRLRLSKRTIQRAVSIGRNLTPEIREAVKGLGLAAKEGELYKLSRQGPALQKRIVKALAEASTPAATVDAALRIVAGSAAPKAAPGDPVEEAYSTLTNAWRKAPATAKKRFLAFLKETDQAAGLGADT